MIMISILSNFILSVYAKFTVNLRNSIYSRNLFAKIYTLNAF